MGCNRIPNHVQDRVFRRILLATINALHYELQEKDHDDEDGDEGEEEGVVREKTKLESLLTYRHSPRQQLYGARTPGSIFELVVSCMANLMLPASPKSVSKMICLWCALLTLLTKRQGIQSEQQIYFCIKSYRRL
jgi:hypothetical protein